ncbi:MAG: hypothetical protein F4Y42_18095 [Caldilineaceae bacterium SB0664_bin_27]|uniref:Uncharacterized protein n=1 Tax=Caldilineaceae bacterium SB0664_bin_27 TaxID=2605260 RepID=A0A6B0YWB5_9CHLR|nr:hypothetical protein [Caldilineaceae bacterium SB0664_bin_27]
MPVPPADCSTKSTIYDLLTPFMIDWEQIDPCAWTAIQMRFDADAPDTAQLKLILTTSDELKMAEDKRYLRLKPTVSGLWKSFPLVALQGDVDLVHFRVYVILAFFAKSMNLQTTALRFETNEGSGGARSRIGTHNFCHVQFCRKIGKFGSLVPSWFPDSQVAFPLDARCQISLVLSMLVSLYGAREVWDKLGDVVDVTHFRKLRAFRCVVMPEGSCQI